MIKDSGVVVKTAPPIPNLRYRCRTRVVMVSPLLSEPCPSAFVSLIIPQRDRHDGDEVQLLEKTIKS